MCDSQGKQQAYVDKSSSSATLASALFRPTKCELRISDISYSSRLPYIHYYGIAPFFGRVQMARAGLPRTDYDVLLTSGSVMQPWPATPSVAQGLLPQWDLLLQ